MADLQRLQTEQGDWICECGFPGIYRREISIQDVPKIYSFAVRHYIYLRYLYITEGFLIDLIITHLNDKSYYVFIKVTLI